MPAPMPFEAPVTTATLFDNLFIGCVAEVEVLFFERTPLSSIVHNIGTNGRIVKGVVRNIWATAPPSRGRGHHRPRHPLRFVRSGADADLCRDRARGMSADL